jgi:hypothetical protein
LRGGQRLYYRNVAREERKMTDVIIGEDRLVVVLAYLADKAPEDVKQRREWARCMAILSAQRKEAPGHKRRTDCRYLGCGCLNEMCHPECAGYSPSPFPAQTVRCQKRWGISDEECAKHEDCVECPVENPDNVALRQPRSCLDCVFNDGCYRREEAATCERFIRSTADDVAGKCGGCELRGNCAEDTIPGGCPMHVGKQTATPPPQYDPATVAFPAYVTRETHERELNEVIDSLSARMDTLVTQGELLAQVGLLRGLVDATGKNHYYHHHENGGIAALSDDVDLLRAAQLGEAEATKKVLDALVNQVKELDKDHVDLLKCYIHHLREHMPEALRNAGEVPSITREELAGVDELRAEVVALEREVTAQPGYFDAAIARAIAAHEITTAEHFQGQIDTLSRVVDEDQDRKAVVAHERLWHNPTGKGEPFPQEPTAPCVRLARVIASAPTDVCYTCRHDAVCRKTLTENTCESWERQHPN